MSRLYKKIKKCRISNDTNLHKLINFGKIALTGVFPKRKFSKILKTPLSVVFSDKSKLLQLQHNYNSELLFGSNYGYRSGLNNSMISHLKDKYLLLHKKLNFKENDNILDIGSNDGTFLNFFPVKANKVGCDPTAKKFKKYYDKDVRKIYSIFDKKIANSFKYKFKLVSAIAMFYDLDNPVQFCKNVEKVIDRNGIFHLEIAYLPDIIKQNSFDTFCQEHLTYFSLISFKYLINRTNFKILDYRRNSINGGSINFDLSLKNSKHKPKQKKLASLYNYEKKNNFHKLSKYVKYFNRIVKNINKIEKSINLISKQNKTIYCFGASTKGNVTLQLCNLNHKKIKGIYDVNNEKFGRHTPGTNIIIKDEKNIIKDKPDYLILLIWHFKKTIEQKFKKLGLNKINIISLFPKLSIRKKK